MFCKFVGNFIFKWARTNFFAHSIEYWFFTVKCYQLLQSNTNNFVQYQSSVWTQWSGYKYCSLNTNNSIQNYSFISTQLNGSEYYYI